MPIAAVLAVFGLTAGTESAGAIVTAADQCGSLIYGYQYWGYQYALEVDQAGEETLYAALALIAGRFRHLDPEVPTLARRDGRVSLAAAAGPSLGVIRCGTQSVNCEFVLILRRNSQEICRRALFCS